MITQILRSDTLNTWRQKTNQIAEDLGDTSLLDSAFVNKSIQLSGAPSGGLFSAGNTVTGSISGATATVVSYDNSNYSLVIKNITGSFIDENVIRTRLTITSKSGSFTSNEVVTGGTSGASGKLYSQTGSTLDLYDTPNTFTVGETVTGGTSGETGVISSISFNNVVGAGETITAGAVSGTLKFQANDLISSMNELIGEIGDIINLTVSATDLVDAINQITSENFEFDGDKTFAGSVQMDDILNVDGNLSIASNKIFLYTSGAISAASSISAKNGALVLTNYDGTSTFDHINNLIPGSDFGSLILTQPNGHCVIGIRGNDASDGFFILKNDDQDVDSPDEFDSYLLGVNSTSLIYRSDSVFKVDNDGDVAIGKDANITGGINVNTNKFNVTAASGNTTIAGTLGVSGTSSLAALNTSGNLAINTNKFNVTAASGNTTIAGTLGVSGTSSLAALNMSGNLAINTNKFTVDSATGNTVIAGNLTVTGGIDNGNLLLTIDDGQSGGDQVQFAIVSEALSLIAGDNINLSFSDAANEITIAGVLPNFFRTVSVTDTNSGYSWSEVGDAVAETSNDTLTLVSGSDIDIDIDPFSDAILIQHGNTSALNGLLGGNGISSITVDDNGHVTAVGTATFLTSYTETDTLDTVTGRGASTSNDMATGTLTAANLISSGVLRGPATFIIDPATWDTSSGTVQIAGGLNVQGTTTEIDSLNVWFKTSKLLMNSDTTGTPSQNIDFEVERGTSTNVALRWNESTDKWQLTNDGNTFYNIARENIISLTVSPGVDSSHYIPFTQGTTNQTPLYDLNFRFNPSTNELQVSNIYVTGTIEGSFTGDLNGNADSASLASQATDATNAANVAITNESNGVTDRYIPFVNAVTGNNELKGDASLKYNPANNEIIINSGAGGVDGYAKKIFFNVGEATSNSEYYLPFTISAVGGNTILYNSSLRYNPSSDTLSAGNFSGNLDGQAARALEVIYSTLGSSEVGYLPMIGSADSSPGALKVSPNVYYSEAVDTFYAPTMTETSDRRLKKSIKPITGALDKVLQLQGVEFNFNAKSGLNMEKRHIGMIAQDVEEVVPELVNEVPEKDIKTIEYSKTVALLIEAIKEQQEQIEVLKSEVAKLKAPYTGG